MSSIITRQTILRKKIRKPKELSAQTTIRNLQDTNQNQGKNLKYKLKMEGIFKKR